jgi:hypothetical protein
MSNWGIKISNQGQDVRGETVITPKDHVKQPEIIHIQYFLAIPYLNGAKEQVLRYQRAASALETTQVNGVIICIHEASCLFEDLSTIAVYAGKCGDEHELNGLWRDIRHHIRHDFREELDSTKDKRKNLRAIELKLQPGIQVDISFKPDSIKIGEITITIQQINNYLIWAESVMTKTLNEAKAKGYIK